MITVNKTLIKKVFEYARVKVIQILHENMYAGENGISVKYLFFEEKESNELIVMFSSLTRKGVSARYNYVKTLRKAKANKLFILDENGPEGRGCYCLGKNRDLSVEKSTQGIINEIKRTFNIKHTFYCGSSKGGWCALNFGLNDQNADIIIGASQYLLGNYFLDLPDIRLESWIFGENWNQNDIESLNQHIKKKLVAKQDNNNHIHIHVSDKEHTYEEHVKYLITDLKSLGYVFDTEILNYPEHGEIVNYFPAYLRKCINSVNETIFEH